MTSSRTLDAAPWTTGDYLQPLPLDLTSFVNLTDRTEDSEPLVFLRLLTNERKIAPMAKTVSDRDHQRENMGFFPRFSAYTPNHLVK